MLKKPQSIKAKEPKCPLCGKECHPELYNFSGTNERGDITGNLVTAFTDKNGKFNLLEHPFYLHIGIFGFIRKAIEKGLKVIEEQVEVIPDSPEGHHLITCGAVKGPDWKEIFEAFGYDINDPQNGVFFPGDMFVACHLHVPLHKGGHGSTFGQDDHEDLKNEMTYVASVQKMIGYILRMKEDGKLCKELSIKSAENFNKTMFDHSQDIFVNVKSFTWTITSDGQDYKPGGIGCYNRYRTITKKRAGMRLENTDSLEGAKGAKAVAVVLAKNLINKRKCDGNHSDDGCESFPPFTDAQWNYDCRYNQFDEGRFK